MIFNSVEFLVFFAVVVILFYTIAPRLRVPMLLVGCFVFYMWWKPEYVVLILISVGIDYFVARRIDQTAQMGRRKALLIVSIVANLGLLSFFKYFTFACESLRTTLGLVEISFDVPELGLLLPVGISFYTFQSMSYTIEVYRGKFPAEKRFSVFCLYVMFFPQLVAGPIERPQNLLPQLDRRVEFDARACSEGFRLILWGLFKKMVIADRLAVLVDGAYANPGEQTGLVLLVATYAFAFQIYCDFSGYSDIAIGSARILGIRLMENFRWPYFSTSIGEFWQRWHVSLSTWFRDFLYIPLGGSRKGHARWVGAILITFLLSGLWHGANWTFAVWGMYHGFLLLLSLSSRGMRGALSAHLRLPRCPTWVQMFFVFHLVLLGWVFFRADSISDAFLILARIPAEGWSRPVDLGLATFDLLVMACCVGALLVVDGMQRKEPIEVRMNGWPAPARWGIYGVLTLVVLNLGAENEIPFIYFQF